MFFVLRSPKKSELIFYNSNIFQKLQITNSNYFSNNILLIYVLEVQKKVLIPYKSFFYGRNSIIDCVAMICVIYINHRNI